MALHLNEYKRPKVVFGCPLEHITFFFSRRREEKKGEGARVCKRLSFGWLCSPVLAPKRSNNLEENI